jgi:HEAT repeat protein
MEQLSEDEQHASLLLGVEAIRRVKDAHSLADIARRLGAAKYEEAVPTLAAIWRDSALVPLRQAAAHALWEIGTPDAREVLVELINDSDRLSVFMAVRAVFDAAPMGAYDRFRTPDIAP